MHSTGTADGRDRPPQVMDHPETVRLEAVERLYGTAAHPVKALDGVSASFHAGTLTAIMGPSGSGKSTLLHCAAGLDRPTGGTVVIDGTDLGSLSENGLTLLRRERVGFVFQAFNLVSALTAEQNVALPLRLAGRAAPPGLIRAALAEVGLAERAGHRPSGLSGGEQQRVAIARALITKPAVVFADEPTGQLDTRASRQVLGMLRGLVDDHGQTMIMVTHDPVTASYADRVLFLADGRVVDEYTGKISAPDGRPGTVTAELVAARMAALEGAP